MSNTSNTPKKCAHAGCGCMAAAGEKYCSTSCEHAAGMITLKCNCGHDGCTSQQM